jgi:hypothetical protein
MVVQGPDSKREGRALSALLGDPPEVSRYLRSDSVVTADDGAKESAEAGVAFDAQRSLSERRSDFGAQGSVVGQKICPSVP